MLAVPKHNQATSFFIVRMFVRWLINFKDKTVVDSDGDTIGRGIHPNQVTYLKFFLMQFSSPWQLPSSPQAHQEEYQFAYQYLPDNL